MKETLKKLFIEELQDIFYAEQQIVEALPEMAKAAESPELKDAFNHHLQETKQQVHRLEQVFKILEMKPKAKKCPAMDGLIEEGQEVIKSFQKSPVRDAALISKAQRIEHYEMAAYGSLRTFAQELDLDEAADLFQETLNEEGNANKTLTKIAQGGLLTTGVNQKAMH
ncbi:MAG: ferritin-like domain-containing protein [Parachlamydiaceae bacterium]|nr:ferritin-like domain-containing protein [Parachlamydiaceae bacterium]